MESLRSPHSWALCVTEELSLADLIGVRVKINRARSHIEELRSNAADFLASSPYTLEKLEKENGDLTYIIKINSDVPIEWCAIVGDIVHNLRSALDLMAWQFVINDGNTPGKNTYFPISPKKDGFGKQLRSSLSGTDAKAKKFVKRLKPYPEGNTILTQLHALDICDKHRLTLIVGAAHKQFVISPKMEADWLPKDYEFQGIAIAPADRQFPLKDGDEVFGIKKQAREGAGFNEPQMIFELAFGDVDEVKGLPLVETLENMERHLRKILEIAEKWIIKK
jgi:hypothetical protein